MKPSRALFLGLAVCASMFTGCQRQTHIAAQKDSMARVRFAGDTSAAEFRLVQNGRVVWDWTNVDSDTVYEVRPGPSEILVRKLYRVGRSGNPSGLVVRRRALLVDAQVFEIVVP